MHILLLAFTAQLTEIQLISVKNWEPIENLVGCEALITAFRKSRKDAEAADVAKRAKRKAEKAAEEEAEATDDSEWKDGATVKRKAACWRHYMCSEPGAALAATFSHSEEGEEENVSEHGTGKRHAGQGVRGRVPVEANACNKRAKTCHVDEHDTMVLDSDSAVAEMEIDAAPEAVQEMEKGKMVEQENPSAARQRFSPPAPRWRHHSRTRTSCRDGDSRIPERIWCAHCQARDPSVWRVKLDGIAQCEMQLKSLLQRSPAIHHTRLEYSQDFVFCRNPELYENWEKKLAVLVRHAAKMAAVSKWLPQAVDAGGVMNVEMEP
ncbi:hypothetical protein CYMTET_23168 [Cymbomonas tetramitiformis]|uniref:Uncharacterized protein n=1 Tax=Cymbomonas tetramitiformis TaxID=36881 RepID=A0AAE0FZY0_9CHLO|nr:hypothetical protein CYMTET_23168 [Cymbomonas tetramitiformis]